MKYKLLSNYYLFILFIVAATLNFYACNKDNGQPANTTVTFSATLDQSQETPPTSEGGTGTCTATYDTVTNELTYTLTWTGLTGEPTAMHFHKADVGVAGDVEIPINGFSASAAGTFSDSATVDQAAENDLLQNKFYVNIHTALHPAGEIRGQLVRQ